MRDPCLCTGGFTFAIEERRDRNRPVPARDRRAWLLPRVLVLLQSQLTENVSKRVKTMEKQPKLSNPDFRVPPLGAIM